MIQQYIFAIFFSLSALSYVLSLEDNNILYTDVMPANISESLRKISDAPIKLFEFKHDSIPGRIHMGVLGIDAQKYFPESVEIVPTYSIPSKDRNKPPVVLHNFPVVDKNVIFMHGVAAIKELHNIYIELETQISDLKNIWDECAQNIGIIELKLSEDIAQQDIEQNLLTSALKEYDKSEKSLHSLRIEEMKIAKDKEVEERKALLEYEDKLTKQRMAYEQELAKKSMEETLKFEKDLLERKELIRREASEKLQAQQQSFEVDLQNIKSNFEKEKIRNEMEAKLKAEKENEEVKLRQMHLQSELETQRIINSIQTISKQISTLLLDILAKPLQLLIIALSLMFMLFLYYLIREFSIMLRTFIQARLGKPSLIRETSVHWTIFSYFIRKESLSIGLVKVNKIFQNVILSDEDRERVIQLALATRNTKRAGAPYRHILLYGPPGTGKTLIARQLAVASGMDYAVMSGGDVGPLGEDAVTQLHSLFKWASRSKKGLLLFIDEAEAFLTSRNNMGVEDAHLRHALNALLYQTGTQSTHFMMVLATNRPNDLDSAVLDRIDVSMKIGLPELDQRISLISLYMKEHILQLSQIAKNRSVLSRLFQRNYPIPLVDEECYSENTLKSIAKKTSGFSGREISKLMIALQYAMFLSSDKKLTPNVLQTTLASKLKEHAEKILFINNSIGVD